jgi:hypothetical protein
MTGMFIGGIMLLSLFIGFFLFMVKDIGWKGALKVTGLTAFINVFVIAAIAFIKGDLG